MSAQILVVEDDAATRITLAHLLRYAGYRVLEAENGSQAIDLLEQESFDVVVTDIMMGDIDGIEVLHTARQQYYQPDVILLTGHGTLDTAIAALRAGAYDYLLKPCTDEDLTRSVAQAVQSNQNQRRLREAAQLIRQVYDQQGEETGEMGKDGERSRSTTNNIQVFQVGELKIGTTRHAVTFAGEPIAVTPIEFALLRCLAETTGQTRGYCEIVRYTHHFEADDVEAQMLVKQHIRNLRKKLTPGYLVNDRGSGYKLVDPATEISQPIKG